MSKFSVDTFKGPLLVRREFLCALLAGNYLGNQFIAEAMDNLKRHNKSSHFYWLDLRSGKIHLPAEHIIDTGQPGSLMKLIAATAIVQENLPSATKIIDCRGAIIVAGKHYICRYPHGPLSLVEAIGQSCNVFFARTARELNADCFLHYLDKFGLSCSIHLTRNKLPNSVELILGLAEQYNFSAMQILQLVSLIAGRGTLLDITNEEKLTSDPGFNERTWNILQSGMQIACQRGTAKKLDPQNKLHLAVKTGTTIHGRTFQSWLAGYFPYESPRYSFCLRSKIGTSYDCAVPAARQYLFGRDWT